MGPTIAVRHCLLWGLLVGSAAAFSFGSTGGFDAADSDKSGALDRAEFRAFALKVHHEVTASLGLPEHAAEAATELGGVSRSTGLGSAAAAGSVGSLLSSKLDSPGFWAAFGNSLLMIIVTEIGDKTFFIAAVLAMRQDRWAVYLGAVGALALMTVLSVGMGYALPNLLPREYTHYASALLFLYFGCRLLKDASAMAGSGVSDELQEVEEELVGKKECTDDQAPYDDAEKGHKGRAAAAKAAATAILTQAFTLTFLAEWGDRSQIATIAMAAAKDPYGVTAGGTLGHALCTGLAVVGGRMLAAKISEKTVATIGGVTFLAFAAHSILFPDAYD